MEGLDLSSYNNRRDLLISRLNNISEIALSLEIKETVEQLKKSIYELRDDKFKIVVVGEFSRGKSMFINALIGKRIFPSSRKPTTAILNKLSYSETPVYRLVMRDDENSYRDITEDEFKKIVAPKEPWDEESEREYENALNDISRIAFADIGYPTELCKGGVEIIDTPGTNDLDSAREEITYKFIPESDVAIMLLSAVQPLGKSEINFLRDRILKADIQKIYFVINFKDEMRTKEDELKVINYVREHLEIVVSNPKIFMVSAKGALNYRRVLNNEEVKGEIPSMESTGFIELEENMSEFLTNERGNIKLSKFIERGIRISTDLRRNSLAISLGTLDMGLKELQQKIDKLKPEVDRVKNLCNRSINNLRGMLLNRGEEIQQELHDGLMKIANSAIKTVDNYQGPLNNRDIVKAAENVVAPMQTQLQYEIDKKQQNIIRFEVEMINKNLEYEWEAVNNLIINELAFGTLDQSLNLLNLQDKVDKDDIYIKTGTSLLGIAAFLGAIHLSVFTIPVAIFGGKRIFSYFKNEHRENVLGKVKAKINRKYRDVIPELEESFKKQWKKNIDIAIKNIKAELDRKSNGMGQQLDSILQEKSKEQKKVDEKRKELFEMDRLLEDIISDLTTSSRLMTE